MGECPYGWGRRKVCKSFTHPSIHPPTHPPILPIGIGEALLVNNIGSSRARTFINRSFFRLQYMMRSTPPLQVGVGGWVGGWVGGEAEGGGSIPQSINQPPTHPPTLAGPPNVGLGRCQPGPCRGRTHVRNHPPTYTHVSPPSTHPPTHPPLGTATWKTAMGVYGTWPPAKSWWRKREGGWLGLMASPGNSPLGKAR